MKRRIAYLLIALIPILALFLYINDVFEKIKQNNIEMHLESDKVLIQKLGSKILEHFSKAEQDALFLASYLEQNLDGTGNLSLSNPQAVNNVMDGILPSFLGVNHAYRSISIVDQNGNETLVAPRNQVQLQDPVNQAGKDYFQGVLRHLAGEVHLSFDDNTVFITGPIYRDAAFYGAVVLSLPKDNLIRELQEQTEDKIMFIEDNGKYILTSNPQPGHDFTADYSSDVLDNVKTFASGHTEADDGTLLTFTPLEFDGHKWFLITESNRDEIIANTLALEKHLLAIVIVTFALILGLLGLWSLSYGKALQAEKLRRENDELAHLNLQLREKQTELEEETAVVEELNAQLEDESRKYQHQKDTLQAIIDSIGTGLVMVDTTGMVIFMNKVWRRIFGYHQADGGDVHTLAVDTLTVDRLIQKVVAGASNAKQVLAEVDELMSNSGADYRTELEYVQSAHRYCRLTSVPCQASDGKALGRIFRFRDITHYKEVDLLKSELISTVSHELRTPMSSIMGFSELLLTRQLSPERSRQYIQVIHEQAERLTKLISDFLDIQRMESGKQVLDKQRLDFVEIVNQGMELFNNTGGKHRILCECNEGKPLYVHGDRDQLIQLLSNLLSNAIKYSPQGGAITVKVSVQKDVLQAGVSDHGLGIPEEAIPKLFSKFFRVDNDDRREIGGTGLGLAICKEIVAAHNGKIWAESAYGEGSTFFFTLPLVEPDLPKSNSTTTIQTAETDHANNARDTILIVEDDENLVSLIEIVLKEDGFAAFAVKSGEDALELVRRVNFKIIILDIILAGKLNGWDVIKALKENEKTARIPVIISSIHENSVESQAQGISNYLVKPFKPEQLLNVVHKVMKENIEDQMWMQGEESIDEYVLNILLRNGIKVKGLKRSDSILMITLGGES